jgi:hypothetical protein
MFTSITDFFPKYPNIKKTSDPLLNPYDEVPFGTALLRKKEFTDLKLPQVEPIPDQPGTLFLHQQYIQRFLSNHTPYNELLIFHEMGTGKTCTAIGAIEGLRMTPDNSYQRAFIFARGDGILSNFKNELVFKCTDGRYIPAGYYELPEGARKGPMISQVVSKFYKLSTFEKSASAFSKVTDEELREKYSNSVIMIDEVHNLRLKAEEVAASGLDIYGQFYRLLKLVTNSKVLLLSGTPMKDQASEIGAIMNLILPEKETFSGTFFNDFFNDKGQPDPAKANEFQQRCKGRVSYLKAMKSQVQKVYQGGPIGNLRYFKVYECIMSRFQSKAYNEAYMTGTNVHGNYSFRIEAQQAALCVFPDGTYGKTGFREHIETRQGPKGGSGSLYAFRTPDIASTFLENLKTYSIKYWTLLQVLNKGQSTFAYIKFNQGSGSILLTLILELFGYTQANMRRFPSSKRKRFILITNETPDIRTAIDLYNNPKNASGEYIQLVIGSRIISEGFTLKQIRNVVIMGGHWNYSEISQAVSRAWRVDSHLGAPPGTTVDIYQLVGVNQVVDQVQHPSVDLLMYEISERKDVQIKAIEYLLKVSCFDCALAKDRNSILGYDYLRECEYQPCEYTCEDQITGPPDEVTFNLYYTRKKEIVDHIRKVFNSNYTLRLKELQAEFPQYTTFEILSVLKDIVTNNEVMIDSFGFPLFVRMENTTLFLTQDISQQADFFSAYYSRCMIIDAKADYPSTLARLKNEYTLRMVLFMFQYPNYVIEILGSLDDLIKQEIVKAALLAQYLNKTQNVYARSQILKYFRIYLTKVDDGYILNLLNQPLFFNTKTLTWSPYKGEVTTLHQTDPNLFKSEIGYYGMVNPALKDQFCLKEIDKVDLQQGKRDLRKVKVGKKCSDYSHTTLVDIVANRMKLPIPETARGNYSNDLTTLQRIIKERNLTVLTKSDMGVEDLRRILYWKSEIRTNLCIYIQDWLKKRNLIEVNENCGKQTKKRR